MTQRGPRRRAVSLLCAGAAVALACAGPAQPAATAADGPAPAADGRGADPVVSGRLDLGPADLPETRTTSTLQPGVTLTRITRGGADDSLFWTLEVQIPDASSPDPDAPAKALSGAADAREERERLRAEGFDARVEAVARPRAADVPPGTLGYRVRVGSWRTRAEADRERARLAAAGEHASSVFTGWDGDRAARGPWHVDVVTVDPRRFDGRLDATFGPDLEGRETTSALARAAGATVGVNAGFFVLDPAAGAPGDPAGVGVYDGKVLSEPVGERPALVLDDRGTSSVERLSWRGSAVIGGRTVPLDGVNRVPGLIRNCGGDRTDRPTSLPLHDVTCTDDSEIVAFTPEYGARTPEGPGREVVLDAQRRVVSVAAVRGTALAPGTTSLQATGDLADRLAAVRVGDRVRVRTDLADAATGRPRPVSRHTTIVNGGPQLVHGGREEITQRRDGMDHADDPSWAYGWVVKRNPRTLAGTDRYGRTVLVSVDGRTTGDLGLSIPEAADVARSLGLVEAVNLDGGGSTAMAVGGEVIGHPSDATGERPVGDAVVVLPPARRP
ncbi:phosphodiester glycosidase family protein [Streptomyces mexicanus]